MTQGNQMTETPEPVRYRKTATITATQWWSVGDHPAVVAYDDNGEPTQFGWVNTLEGGHAVTPGDWIATGVRGEHWPIKPDVFAASYVPDTPTSNPYLDLDVGSITVPIGYVRKMVEAIDDMRGAMRYWAGCDEGVSDDIATTEIMSAGGTWPSVSYDKATDALELGQSVITAFDQGNTNAD